MSTIQLNHENAILRATHYFYLVLYVIVCYCMVSEILFGIITRFLKINYSQLLKVCQILKLRIFIISGIETAAEEGCFFEYFNGGIGRKAIGNDTVPSTCYLIISKLLVLYLTIQVE